jgi:hypothetical protein
VELLGTIEPGAEHAIGKPEWINLIEAHPHLSSSPPKQGINPFTRKPHLYQPNPTGALVVIEGSQIGSIHWAMDDSRRLVVWSNAGAEEKVRSVATDVAVRLGWQFVRGNTAPN